MLFIPATLVSLDLKSSFANTDTFGRRKERKRKKKKRKKMGKGIRHWVLKHVGPSYTSIDYRHIHPIEFIRSLKIP